MLITIRPMTHKDAPTVAAIHRRVLPTATARLGSAVLEHFYRTVITDPSVHAALVAVSGRHIVGAITATRDNIYTQSRLQAVTRNPKIIFATLASLITGTVTIVELLERLRTEREISASFSGPYQTILTLIVDTAWQRRGIGSMLITELGKHLSPGTILFVDTERKNAAAQAFYETMGFKKRKTVKSSIVLAKPIRKI